MSRAAAPGPAGPRPAPSRNNTEKLTSVYFATVTHDVVRDGLGEADLERARLLVAGGHRHAVLVPQVKHAGVRLVNVLCQDRARQILR